MFEWNITSWSNTEYGIILLGIIFVFWIVKKIFSKAPPLPTTPPCGICGKYDGVSKCTYCNKSYCQIHVFRESHKCQGWRQKKDNYQKITDKDKIFI